MNEIIYLNLIPSGDQLAKFSRYSDLAAGWKTEKLSFSSRQRQDFFSYFQKFLALSEPHPASYSVGTRGTLVGDKAAGV